MRNPPAVSLFLISESRVCFQTLSIFQVQLENRWFTRNTGRIPRKPWVCSNQIMQNHANTFFFLQFASEFDILFPSEFLPHFLSDLFYVFSMDCPFQSQPRFLGDLGRKNCGAWRNNVTWRDKFLRAFHPRENWRMGS